ncbi:MAG: pyridoxamine 5'-phosphate oxidase family protein [Mangrovibacterium sp.]
MSEGKKLSEKFYDVLKYEGVVAIMTSGIEPHMVNSWNSYIVVTDDERLLFPVYGYRKTGKNLQVNNNIVISLGSKEVLGYKDYQGTGFIVKGTASYIESGPEFEMMKEKFSFLNRVLEVKVIQSKQML